MKLYQKMIVRWKLFNLCESNFITFFKINLFIFGSVGSQLRHTGIFCCGTWASLQLWHVGFSLAVACGLQSTLAQQSWHVGSRVHGLSSCGAWPLQLWCMGSRARGLCSCSAWAQLPLVMWDVSSPTRDRTCIACIGRRILNHWTTSKVP